jgi:hypothetical protein
MICFAKPGLAEDLYIVHKKIILTTCHMWKRTLDKGEAKPIHPLVREAVI